MDIQTIPLTQKAMTSSSRIPLLAALLCMASCAKEVAPVANQGGDNLLCAFMPSPTKTALGDKEGNSYPVFWTEGDCLAVNGEKTSAAAILEDRAKANFTIPSSVSLPYNIVYPAVDGATGTEKVIFPAEQEYKKGSFCPGAAPMYAYTVSYDHVQMHYLAGVLRLNIKGAEGQTVRLSRILLSSESQIAGEYSVDCEDGTMTPSSVPQYNISYILPEGGLAASDEALSFFICIPSGDFGVIKAEIISVEGSAMVLELKADNIRAGIVREYPVVSFSSDAEYFVIGDDAQMMEFAQAVARGTFNKDKAVLVNDIDMSEASWHSIDKFTGTFDGAGHRISNLKAPLFNVLDGVVCNTNLSVDIDETENAYVGAVARKFQGGAISNVCVDGAISYEPALTSVEAFIGAIAGDVSGGEISSCTNEATVKVSMPADAKTAKVRMAGIAGRLLGTENARPQLIACENRGILTPALQASSELLLAGIVARNEYGVLENCHNKTDIVMDASADYLYAGAVAGLAKNGTIKDCTNSGAFAMTASSKVNTYCYSAGICGYTHSVTVLDNCVNSGDITVSGVDWNATRMLVGGIAGYGNENTTIIKDCTNEGKVSVGGKVKGSATFCGVGGIAGRTMAAVSGCSNEGAMDCALQVTSSETGVGGIIGTAYSLSVSDCTNNAAITYNVTPDPATSFCKAFYLGGAIGSAGPTAAGTYEYSGLHNTAAITVNGTPAVMAIKTGGAAGRNNTARDDMTDLNRIAIGGVFGRVLLTSTTAVTTVKECSNNGAISAPDAGKIRYTAFGGVCGEMIAANATVSNCENSGDISVARAYNDGTNLHLGGVVGFIPNKKFTECTIKIYQSSNSGDISLSEINNTIQEARAGGILADAISTDSRCLNLTIEECVNRGDISRVSNKRFASQSFGGGIVGSLGAGTWSFNAGMSDFVALVKNCDNYGDIQFDACTSKGTILTDQTYNESATGGIVGNLRGTAYTTSRVRNAIVESCRNHGKVTGYSGFLGGICGIVSYYGTITGDCLNEGEVGFRYYATGEKNLTNNAYESDLTTCGGIAGELFQGKLPTDAAPGYNVRCENAVNKADVGGVRFAGGIAGAFNEAASTANDIQSCANCGTIYGFYGKAGAITSSEKTTDETLGRVRGCKVGGTVVRGSMSVDLNAENYFYFIYQKSVSDDGLNSYWDGK